MTTKRGRQPILMGRLVAPLPSYVPACARARTVTRPSTYPLVAASAAALGVANCARPAESRITRRFAVADDVAPWMPEVASMWLLAAASVVAGASHQLLPPVMAR